ncbi:hypothetical protein FRZ06_18080 [Anoxybacterium hadale]|uniref:Uncharacterized protein n=1 Tax=Anoxybacterium hadale TaxID=3408580 RepID=A0ACD1AG19_9FIRM|nr:hypothetical protein FRZ06_18080 [Clostridiales bacterium]
MKIIERRTFIEKGKKKKLTIFKDTSAKIEYVNPKYNMKVILKFPAQGTVTNDDMIDWLSQLYMDNWIREYQARLERKQNGAN